MSEILKLSCSKVKLYDSCQRKFYFTYILKLPRKEFDYHILGKCVHSILETFHLALINGSTDPLNKIMSNAYSKVIEEVGHKLKPEMLKESYDIIDKYLQNITSDKHIIKNILAVEKSFNLEIKENVFLNGMIDRIQIDEDGVLNVIDYKTTKNKKYLKNDFFQLLTYAYVLLQENPDVERARGSYILLKHNCERIVKEFSKEEILEIKKQYEDYAEKIRNENLYRPNPNRLCSYCEYLDKCNEGQSFVNANIKKFGQVGW